MLLSKVFDLLSPVEMQYLCHLVILLAVPYFAIKRAQDKGVQPVVTQLARKNNDAALERKKYLNVCDKNQILQDKHKVLLSNERIFIAAVDERNAAISKLQNELKKVNAILAKQEK